MYRYLLLIAFLIGQQPSQAQKKVYDWLIMYYMPYDNDLSDFKMPILNQFRNLGLKGNICITIQTDQAGDHGLTRYIINSTWDSLKVNGERSASAKVFQDYLNWGSQQFKANHYAIILLSHGGLVNEYGLDQFPQQQWLSIDSLAKAIQTFNKTAGISKIDLLFEQVCTRGTVENFYEFRDIAKFTMASQTLVPLPNMYYGNTMKWLDAGGVTTGKALAEGIVENERSDMYYSYTLVNNGHWKQWASLWIKYNRSTQEQKIELKRDSLLTISYSTDFYFDMVSLLKSIRINNKQPGTVQTFIDFTNNKLIERLYLNPENNKMNGYSGISILTPFRENSSNLALQQTAVYRQFQSSMKRLKK
jgi:Clostripain family